MTIAHRLRRWLLWLALLPAVPALAQAPTAAPPSSEQIRERIADLEAASGMDEQLRTRLLELYRLTVDRLETAKRYAATAEDYQRQLKAAPETTRRLRRQIAAVAPATDVESRYGQSDLNAIKQALSQEQATLAALQSKLSELQEQLRALQARPARAQEELAQAKLEQTRLDTELQSVTEGDERLLEARRASLLARRHALGDQIRMLEQELLSQDARQSVLQAQRDLASRQVEAQAALVKALEDLANRRSLAGAAQVAESAERATQLAETPAVVQQAAAANAALSEELADLVQRLEQASTQQQQAQRELERLRAHLHDTQRQLEIAGLSEAVGEVLRRERRSLPTPAQYADALSARRDTIAQARLRQFQLEQAPDENLERQVAALLAEHLGQLDPAAAPAVADRLRELLTDRAALHQQLSLNYGRYIDQLLALNRDDEQIVAQLRQYTLLLDENLFWIASARPMDLAWWRELPASLRRFADQAQWRSLPAPIVAGATGQPLNLGAMLLLTGALLSARRPLRRRLARLAAMVGRPADRFALTLQALWYSLLLALPWPLLPALLGWLLLTPGAQPWARAAGTAMIAVAMVSFLFELARQLCRDKGVLAAHFRWSLRPRRALRRNLSWLLAVTIPLTSVVSLTEAQPDEQLRNSVGRMAFIAASAALALFAARVLSPRAALLGARPGSNAWRGARALQAVMTAAPLLLALLAGYGYYYTALQLESRLFSSIALSVALALATGLALRSIRLARRRISQRGRGMLLEGPPHAPGPRLKGDLDLNAADDQTRSLLRVLVGLVLLVGLWLIWADLLPALNILREVVLWQRIGGGDEQLVSVTLGHLLLAVGLAALTLVAVRNLPGALEITLLSRLALDPGSRYAVTTLSRYVTAAVGLLVALNLLGLRWGQAQWLVAALGVGLGFGLQEIFANFVSGLILLFERPIRVGDTVTVGELSGQVARIRIRATTITDFDRREIIIPNKTFITDRLINWSLSDQVSRLVLQIDVAFGAPPEQVRELLLEAVRAEPRVLAQPEPNAYLASIGETAQRFELYAYVGSLSDRLPTRHALYTDIQRRLDQAGIAIAVPMRDLRVRPADAAGDHPARPP